MQATSARDWMMPSQSCVGVIDGERDEMGLICVRRRVLSAGVRGDAACALPMLVVGVAQCNDVEDAAAAE